MDQISSFTCSVSVYFNDYNNPPVAIDSSLELPLFSSEHTSIGFVIAYDVDNNQTLTYSIIGTFLKIV